jgi:hypothetical protein
MTLVSALVMQDIGAGHTHGFNIVDVTGYPTGTVSPAVPAGARRLRAIHWEAEYLATGEGRPARRYYEITASGVKALDAALHALRQLDAASRRRPRTAE